VTTTQHTDTQSSLSPEQLNVLMQTWIDTRMERDKSLLLLSGGAIGLLAGLVGPLAVLTGVCEVVLLGLSAVAFAACILSVLCIFTANSRHLEQVRAGVDNPPHRWLDTLDATAVSSFVVGILLAIALGLTIAARNLDKSRTGGPHGTPEEHAPGR
jgi:hypothetical protein